MDFGYTGNLVESTLTGGKVGQLADSCMLERSSVYTSEYKNIDF